MGKIFKTEEEKMEMFLDKYDLFDLPVEYRKSIENIRYWMSSPNISSMDKLVDRTTDQLLRATYEQNWIIIKQLNELNKKLEK